MKRSGLVCILVVVLLAAGWLTPAAAAPGGPPPTPSNNAGTVDRPLSVSGHVRNALGVGIAGAVVSDGQLLTTTTDSTGYYSLQFLALGTYNITASATGMDTSSKLVSLTFDHTSETQEFTLRWLTSGTVNRQFITTAVDPFTLTHALSTYAPPSSCAEVLDSRTGASSSVTLSAGGSGTSTASWSSTLAQGSPEGTYTLTSRVSDCATGTQIDVGATAMYVVDNTAPALQKPMPADNGTTVSSLEQISAYAQDTLSGIDPVATAMTLDDLGVSEVTGSLGTSAVIAFDPVTPLFLGAHTVRLEAADRAGNVAAALEWKFVHSAWDGDTAGTAVDPASVSTVPVAPPGSTLAISSRIRVEGTTVTLDDTGHAGFGLLCGALNVSGLRARFSTVDGGQTFVAPSNIGSSTRQLCRWLSVFDMDTTNDHEFILPGDSYSLGDLVFPIPTTATPLSTATLVYAGPSPTLEWTTPCTTVNAAVTPQTLMRSVCDPLPNYFDVDHGSALMKDRFARSARHNEFTFDGSFGFPTVWSKAGSNWSITTSVDVTRAFASSPMADALSPVSPYKPVSGTHAVLYRGVDRYTRPLPDGNTRSALEATYFRWSGSYDGGQDGIGFLATSWPSDREPSANDQLVLLDDESEASKQLDDSGDPIAWTALADPEAAAMGFQLRSTVDGVNRFVRAADFATEITDDDQCSYCDATWQWVRVQDTRSHSLVSGGARQGVSVVGPAAPDAIAEQRTSAEPFNCPMNGTLPFYTASSNDILTRCPGLGGGGSADPDAESGDPPGETTSYYLTKLQAETGNDGIGPSHLCTRSAPPVPADFNKTNCNAPYSMGYYAQNGGMHVLFAGAFCKGSDGTKGLSLFVANPTEPANCTTSIATVTDLLKVWLDGYAAGPGHVGKVRVAISGSNNIGTSIEESPTETVNGALHDVGYKFYMAMDLVRDHAIRVGESAARSGRSIQIRVSGANDVEQHWNGASHTLPVHRGWNDRADETNKAYKLNLYAVDFLSGEYGNWNTHTLNGWTAEQYWLALWGKGRARYDEDYTIPQIYHQDWPRRYAALASQVPDDKKINFSGIAWSCDSLVTPAKRYGSDARGGVASANAYEDFVAEGPKNPQYLPVYRTVVTRRDYAETC